MIFFALAAAVALFSGAPGARAESDSAFTDTDTLSESLFPAQRMLGRYSRPSAVEAKRIRYFQKVVARQIEVAGGGWLGPIAGQAPAGKIAMRGALSAFQKSPVWVCQEECRCESVSPAGCATGRDSGGSVGTVIYVHRCIFGPRGGCRSLDRRYASMAGPAILYEVLTRAATQIAHFRIHGAVDWKGRDRATALAVRALDKSSAMISRMVGACPGPFPIEGLRYLRESGHLRDLGPYASECGTRLLAPLKADPLPEECRAVIDPTSWETGVKKGLAWGKPPVIRCDELCATLTCGDESDRRPRPIRFGMEWFLSLPEGACEGTKPVDARGFIETLLSANLNPGIRSDAGLLIRACARRLAPEASRRVEAGTSTGSGGSGPDVPLVEP